MNSNEVFEFKLKKYIPEKSTQSSAEVTDNWALHLLHNVRWSYHVILKGRSTNFYNVNH